MSHHLKLSLLTLAASLSACSIAQNVTIKDVAQQNVAVESPTVPHLQGALLEPGQLRVQGEYRYAAANDPTQPITDTNNTEGHSNAVHVAYGQVVMSVDQVGGSWEFGVFGGGALKMTEARVQNTTHDPQTFESVSAPFVKLGLGLRGPLVRKERFTIGLNLEAEASRHAYQVDLYRVRTTEATINYSEELFGKYTPESMSATTQSSERLTLEDYVYSVTPRLGVFGDVIIIPQLHLLLGLSAQMSERASAYAEDECTYETSSEQEIITFGALNQCDPKDTFPLQSYQAYLTYYGGLSLQLAPLSLNVTVSSATALGLDVHAPVPFQLNSSVGLAF